MSRPAIPRALDVALLLAWVLPTTACALGIAMLLVTGNRASGHDIISYWAAAKLLHAGGNPYDHAAVFALQRANGLPGGVNALMVRNPPPILPLIAPLGWMGLRAASLVWSSLLLAAWAVSCWSLWDRRDNNLLVLVLFGPALFCIMTGQSAIFCLLGVVLFLRFVQSHPAAAGACLSLCALKPHLFVPAAGVFLLWCVVERQWRVVAGLAAALLVAGGVAFGLDPHAWPQYRAMLAAEPMQHEFIPCLAVALRSVTHAGAWTQYVLCVAAAGAAAAFYVRNRARWSWAEHGPLLLAVSVVVAPYAWITDQVLLLPAVWQLLARRNWSMLRLAALLSAAMTVEFLGGVSLHSPAFLWAAPAWLVLCLYGQRAPQPTVAAEDRPGIGDVPEMPGQQTAFLRMTSE